MIAIEVQWPQLFAFVRSLAGCCCCCFELIWECLWLFLSFFLFISRSLRLCMCVCLCYARNVSIPNEHESMRMCVCYVWMCECALSHTCVQLVKLRRLIAHGWYFEFCSSWYGMCVLLLNYVCGLWIYANAGWCWCRRRSTRSSSFYSIILSDAANTHELNWTASPSLHSHTQTHTYLVFTM